MAKQKKKILPKKRKAPVRKVKKNSGLKLKQSIIALIILILLFVGIIRIFEANSIKNPTFNKNLSVSKKLLKPKALISPYLSISPKVSPTPIPLTGFCIHVPIFMYHHIQPESNAKQLGQTALTVDSAIFDTQMAYLAQNGYTTLFADELTNALINHSTLPQKSVVITMDDGYEDNYIYALPVLKKYGIKANIMLATGLMGNSNMLSWEEVKNLRSSGLIYFTNHTWSHYAVSNPPQSKIDMEIDTAQKQIQDNTGQITNIFTYPYGQFNNNAIQTLISKGYKGAFSEIPGQYQCDSFIMTLHRTRIGNASLTSYGL